MFFCKQQKVESSFRIHSLLTCALFIGKLSPLILSDINDQWLLTPFIFSGGFPSLSCAGGGLLDA